LRWGIDLIDIRTEKIVEDITMAELDLTGLGLWLLGSVIVGVGIFAFFQLRQEYHWLKRMGGLDSAIFDLGEDA
jgi:hypothetical protein|tara:strand:- start:1032 stop:1253 length:222 start_codon:yes stop_codon:yes gene_type:complete